MEYLNATRSYIVIKIGDSSFEEYSKAVERFGITEKDLRSDMWLCADAPSKDYIVVPVDNTKDWQFMTEAQFKSAFTVINSTTWRK